MSKRNLKNGDLPKLQKKIVFSLAKEGAMTMSETNRRLKGENTSTTRAFHELESKEMVKKIGATEYRGREFSKYWLSERGMAFALLNSNVKPDIIRIHALSFDKTLEIYFDLRSLSPRIANVLDRLMVLAGTVNSEDLVKQLGPEIVFLERADMMKFLDMAKKSREFSDFWKQYLKNMKRFLETEGKGIGD